MRRGREANGVISAEQSSNMKPNICLQGKAMLFAQFLACY